MTILLETPLQRRHTLPTVRGRNGDWHYELSNKSTSVTELVDINGVDLCYISLRDLISSVDSKRGSPPRGKVEWCDLSHVTFKDRLVKQAALAYLQPMVIERHHEHFFLRHWRRLTTDRSFVSDVKNFMQTPLQACFEFFSTHVYSRFSRMLASFADRVRPKLFWFLRFRSLA